MEILLGQLAILGTVMTYGLIVGILAILGLAIYAIKDSIEFRKEAYNRFEKKA